MNRAWAYGQRNLRIILTIGALFIALAWLLFYKLGSLTGGLSQTEVQTAGAAVGWHGIYHQPLYLPLKLVRSVVFWLSPNHGQFLTRLPNVIFGGLSIAEFIVLIRLWHGQRTAILTGTLFACGAWILHASRLASFDVMYLWLLPTLLLINAALSRYAKRASIWFASLIGLALIIYLPGAIWLVLAELYFLKLPISTAWHNLKQSWQRLVSLIIIVGPLALLIIDLFRAGQLKQWLGLPAHFDNLASVGKHFAAVPVHLLIRGPEYPQIWLGRAALLDIFTLAMSLIGIYFYATHFRSGRSHLLLTLFVISWILIALGGPVGLSLLVPLMYAAAATGIAYLLHEWLHVFPLNPLARATGIGLVSILIAFSAVYNLRSYFVAWPHNPTTRAVFHYRR
jgi:hypothetical protein